MCKYCNQKKWGKKEKTCYSDYEHRITLDDGGWTGLYMGIDKNDYYYLSAVGEDEARCIINYCPMCGRQLKKEV